jgi:hypothetical protein
MEGKYVFGQSEVGSLVRVIAVRKVEEKQNKKVLIAFATTCLTV